MTVWIALLAIKQIIVLMHYTYIELIIKQIYFQHDGRMRRKVEITSILE